MKLLTYVHLRNIYQSTGAGRVARNVVEALARRDDVDLHVLGDRSDHERIVDKVGVPWTGFPYHLFDSDTSVQQRRWLLTGHPKAERFWPEADLLYCTGESYVPTKRIPSVVVMHDAAYFEDDALDRNWRFRLQREKWRWMFRRIARDVDMVHAVSAFSAERLSHHFPALRGRIQVVHNAVTDLFFDADTQGDDALLAPLGLSERPFILIPRGLSYRKNAALVLEALPKIRARHPDVRLVVTSHNDPAYVARARAIDPDIVTPGFVDDLVLRALYRHARLVWFPSRYEGFGLPVLEAMACGTPVVASDATSLPEVAGGAALLAGVDDVAGHVDAVVGLLDDDAARTELAEAGRARAAGFTWDNAAARLAALFAERIA